MTVRVRLASLWLTVPGSIFYSKFKILLQKDFNMLKVAEDRV